MKKYKNPNRKEWSNLITRPAIQQKQLSEAVQSIMRDVKLNGDKAVFKYISMFDGATLEKLIVSEKEINDAIQIVPSELKNAIKVAKKNIEVFHNSQIVVEQVIETSPGVNCWRKSVAIEKVGLYIPGGSAPLFSTILMLGIPAKIAGCNKVVLCTPTNKYGEINPAILYTANLVGLKTIYKIGGAQAIAGLTYGTESILKVDKIFGPGNQYVTKAKEMAQQDGVAIDMPAGPSEVLVIADTTSNPAFVAADLLSQAEHGEDSQVILVSDNEEIINSSLLEIEKQLVKLPRNDVAKKALENSKAILFNSIDECLTFSNEYAPEHLIFATDNAESYLGNIINAGSVFIGNYSCESAGDYASGTNHTLPTNGYAKNYSGVSLDSFVKKITFQKLSKEGIKGIGNAIELMAEAEGLFAHKNAVTLRLKEINNV
ncbi:MAG: histidinol dehydrogenase [Vicingaceae bacterium]|jgi:histidinol dehydrogenase